MSLIDAPSGDSLKLSTSFGISACAFDSSPPRISYPASASPPNGIDSTITLFPLPPPFFII